MPLTEKEKKEIGLEFIRKCLDNLSPIEIVNDFLAILESKINNNDRKVVSIHSVMRVPSKYK